jgi:hypothetical protein
MLNLQYVTLPKPGAAKNEDLFGFKGDTFWMLDGATSTDGPALERDAHWLVQEMDTTTSARILSGYRRWLRAHAPTRRTTGPARRRFGLSPLWPFGVCAAAAWRWPLPVT